MISPRLLSHFSPPNFAFIIIPFFYAPPAAKFQATERVSVHRNRRRAPVYSCIAAATTPRKWLIVMEEKTTNAAE